MTTQPLMCRWSASAALPRAAAYSEGHSSTTAIERRGAGPHAAVPGVSALSIGRGGTAADVAGWRGSAAMKDT